MSKTALLGLTKVLAQEVGHSGIRVNCIAPGVIQTKFSSMVIVKFISNLPLPLLGAIKLFNIFFGCLCFGN